jgi:hypothetical protein
MRCVDVGKVRVYRCGVHINQPAARTLIPRAPVRGKLAGVVRNGPVRVAVGVGTGLRHDLSTHRRTSGRREARRRRPGAFLVPDPFRCDCRGMHTLALSHHTGTRLAEVGFLLIVIAGVWLVAAEALGDGWQRTRTIVAGAALAVAGILLIIATHSGHFG